MDDDTNKRLQETIRELMKKRSSRKTKEPYKWVSWAQIILVKVLTFLGVNNEASSNPPE